MRRALCTLGMIDAGLGQKEEALREGRRAVELVPIAKDGTDGPPVAFHLALIYAWTGERDLAIEQLEIVSKIPNGPTYGMLRLDPVWDSSAAIRGSKKSSASRARVKPAPPITQINAGSRGDSQEVVTRDASPERSLRRRIKSATNCRACAAADPS